MDCAIWSKTAVLWKDANWLWSMCGPPPLPPVPVVTIGNQPGVDATTLITPWMEEEQWNPYRAADEEQKRRRLKRLIKLICKVKGEEYTEEKATGNYKVTVYDIKMVIESVGRIDLDVRNVEE